MVREPQGGEQESGGAQVGAAARIRMAEFIGQTVLISVSTDRCGLHSTTLGRTTRAPRRHSAPRSSRQPGDRSQRRVPDDGKGRSGTQSVRGSRCCLNAARAGAGGGTERMERRRGAQSVSQRPAPRSEGGGAAVTKS